MFKEIVGGKSIKETVAEISKTNPCRCDLDNWEPEKLTGHSWVCPIHQLAKKKHDDNFELQKSVNWNRSYMENRP